MSDSIELTAKGSGYYKVRVNGVIKSQHVTEREAVERAVRFKSASPESDVSYFHDYEVDVTLLVSGGLQPPIETGTPSAPTNWAPTLASITDTSGFGTYTIPTRPNLTPIVRARITGSGSPFADVTTLEDEAGRVSFLGLTPATAYDTHLIFRSTMDGDSAPSNEAEITTLAAATKPAAPSALALASNTDTTASITWTDNSSEDAFVPFVSTDGGSTFIELTQSFAQNAVAGVINTLNSSQAYQLYLVARRGGAPDSDPSNIISFTTNAASGSFDIQLTPTTVDVTVGTNVVKINRVTAAIDSSSTSAGAQFNGGSIAAKSGTTGTGMTARTLSAASEPEIDEENGVVNFEIPVDDFLIMTITYFFFAGSPHFMVQGRLIDKQNVDTHEDSYHPYYETRYFGDLHYEIATSKTITTPKSVTAENIFSQGETDAHIKIKTELEVNANTPGRWLLGTDTTYPTIWKDQRLDNDLEDSRIRLTNIPAGTYTLEVLSEEPDNGRGTPGALTVEIESTSGVTSQVVAHAWDVYRAVPGTYTLDANGSISILDSKPSGSGGSEYSYFTAMRLTPSVGSPILAHATHVGDDAIDASPHAMVLQDFHEQSPTELYTTANAMGVRLSKNPDFVMSGGTGIGFELFVSQTNDTAALLSRAQTPPTPVAANAYDESAITNAASLAVLNAEAPSISRFLYANHPAGQNLVLRGDTLLGRPYLDNSNGLNGDRMVIDVGGGHYEQLGVWHANWRMTGDARYWHKFRKTALFNLNSEITKYDGFRGKHRGNGRRKGATSHWTPLNRPSINVDSHHWPALMHIYNNYRRDPNLRKVAKMQIDWQTYIGNRDIATNLYFTENAARGMAQYIWGVLGGIRHFASEGTTHGSTTSETPIPPGTSYRTVMDNIWAAHKAVWNGTYASGESGWMGAGESSAINEAQQMVWLPHSIHGYKEYHDILAGESDPEATAVADMIHGTVDRMLQSYIVVDGDGNSPGEWQISYQSNADFSTKSWTSLGDFGRPTEGYASWWLKAFAISHSMRPNAAVLNAAVGLYNQCLPYWQTLGKQQRLLSSIDLGHFIDEFGASV